MAKRSDVTDGMRGGAEALGAAIGEREGSTQVDADRVVQSLREIREQLDHVAALLDNSLSRSSRAQDACQRVRRQLEPFLIASGRFPDFCDVGLGIFDAIHDWHVLHRQRVQMSRASDGRASILFMFTRLVLQPDADTDFVGVPYDGG